MHEIALSIFGADHGCTAVAVGEVVKAKHFVGEPAGVVSALEEVGSISAVKEDVVALRSVKVALEKARMLTGLGLDDVSDVAGWDADEMGVSAEMWSVKAMRLCVKAAGDGEGYDTAKDCQEVHAEAMDALKDGNAAMAAFLQSIAACARFGNAFTDESFLAGLMEKALKVLEKGESQVGEVMKWTGEGEFGPIEPDVARQLILTLNLLALRRDGQDGRASASKALLIADEVFAEAECSEAKAIKATILCTFAGILHDAGSVLEAEGLYATGIDLYREIKLPSVACQRSMHAHFMDCAQLIDKWHNRTAQADGLRVEASKLHADGIVRAEFLQPLQTWCLPE